QRSAPAYVRVPEMEHVVRRSVHVQMPALHLALVRECNDRNRRHIAASEDVAPCDREVNTLIVVSPWLDVRAGDALLAAHDVDLERHPDPAQLGMRFEIRHQLETE